MNSISLWLLSTYLLFCTFGEAFAQTTVQFFPWFPGPTDSIVVRIGGCYLQNPAVVRQGNRIQITLARGIQFTGCPPVEENVQLGQLAPGRYPVEIYGTGDSPDPNGKLQTLTEVTVTSQFSSAVEFFKAATNSYFMSADPAEVAQYDGLAGWARTGKSLKVWPFVDTPNDPYSGFLNPATLPSYALRVCKFLNGQSGSAFYSGMFEECVFLKQLQQQANASTFNGWSYQGIAFAALPTRAGQCEPGARPVYRVYNNGHLTGNANHRWTDDASVYQQMLAQGWVGDGAAFCVPY
jgi:Repeat of unknown function (DUF5648)